MTGGHPTRTRAGRLNEAGARWISRTTTGAAFAHWLSKTISLPQLKRLAAGEIPWAPLREPLAEI